MKRHRPNSTKCPKCPEGYFGMPQYVGGFGGEYLVYRCTTCGYSENRDTQDQQAGNSFMGAHKPSTPRR